MNDYGLTTPRNAALRCIPIKVSGIYRITNKTNGKIYIGSARDIRRRLRHHLIALRNGAHVNRHLQNAFKRDGEAAFIFEVLLLCDKADLIIREQEFLDEYKCYNDTIGYNLNPRADAAPITVYTEEMRAAISARFKGKAKSPEHRRKIGDAQRIRTCSPEMRTHLSHRLTAYFSDPANRAAQSKRQSGLTRRGTPLTEEHKKKLSDAKRGRPAWNRGIPHTDEAKRKISAANTGRKASEETRRMMSLIRTGKSKKKTGPLSPEHKQALSAVLRGKPNIKNRKYSDEDIAKWATLRNSGKTFFEIGRDANIAPPTVFRAIRRYLKEHPDGTHDPEQRQGMA